MSADENRMKTTVTIAGIYIEMSLRVRQQLNYRVYAFVLAISHTCILVANTKLVHLSGHIHFK